MLLSEADIYEVYDTAREAGLKPPPFVDAKANYEPMGEECSEEQSFQLRRVHEATP